MSMLNSSTFLTMWRHTINRSSARVFAYSKQATIARKRQLACFSSHMRFNLCLLYLRFLLHYIALLVVLSRHAMIAPQSSVTSQKHVCGRMKCERNSSSVKKRVLWVQPVLEFFFPTFIFFTFEITKPWTPEIYLECYCFNKIQSGVRKLCHNIHSWNKHSSIKKKTMNIAVTWDRNDVCVGACCDCK